LKQHTLLKISNRFFVNNYNRNSRAKESGKIKNLEKVAEKKEDKTKRMRDKEKGRPNYKKECSFFSPFPYALEFMTSQNSFLSLDLGK
jgi:hypothetical protein